MLFEVVAALFLALLVIWMILEPLYRPSVATPPWEEPEDPEETKRGIALIALKEIDFDRATGKLSEVDYEDLKSRYAKEAIEAIDEEQGRAPLATSPPDDEIERLIAGRVAALDAVDGQAETAHPTCPHCGPRPEPDALYCSACGAALGTLIECPACRATLEPESRFCGHCGSPVANGESLAASGRYAPSA